MFVSTDFVSWIDTSNAIYKAEAEIDARYVQDVIGALDSAIAGIKGDIISGTFKTNAGTHHALIRMGQLPDMHNMLTGEDRDMEYLFSDDGEWYRYVAGFIGDPAGIHDGNGAPLHVGDTVINVVDDKPNERMVILSGKGACILSQEWIDRNHAVKGADYESSNIITANINPTCTISRHSCLNEFYHARQRAHPEYDVPKKPKLVQRQR